MTPIMRLLAESPLWDAFSRLFQSFADVLRQFHNREVVPETIIFQDDETIASYELDASGVASFVGKSDDQAFLSSEIDVGETFIWDSIVEAYDDAGNLVRRTSTNDNGFVQIDSYVDGARIAKDLIDGADEFAWSDVRNSYEGDARTAKETVFDNGVYRYDTFLNGIRNFTQQIDTDAFVWSSVEATYDAQGQITSRLITYDDGAARSDTFISGIRVQAEQTDSDVSQYDWDTITSTYGFDGALSSKTIIYDTGVVRSDVFLDGNRTSSVQSDLADAFLWNESKRLYDNGTIVSQRTLEDDGDIVLMLYENGARDERIEHDVSGQRSWDVRITTYDADGVAGVQTFNGTEILEDYPSFTDLGDPVSEVPIG